MLISQRQLHKDSLTQVETLIAMRLIAPQDRAAVEDWIGEWADPKQGREVIASLPSLPRGSGRVWAPELDLLARMAFPLITTFDSSSTPEHGELLRPLHCLRPSRALPGGRRRPRRSVPAKVGPNSGSSVS
jgi:hypothetical protein